MSLDPLVFLNTVSGHTRARDRTRTNRMGTIDPAYTSGLPRVQFDGEDEVSGKTYPHLASYTPSAGDRVVLLPVGHSYVILGEVTWT